MKFYNADLHVHSPHSIAVSKTLNLDTMIETSRKKGLNILGTGDVLQPDWFNYMKQNLQRNKEGSFYYKDTYFILQSEIEDEESIHHVVLFPNFESVLEIQKKLTPYSKNINDEWGGRPRVNLSPGELIDTITDCGAIIGPAHAFTPFKAIFRQNKFKSLVDCYQSSTKKVSFLELGLSANTELADRLDSLKDVSFLSNSDAHSESPRSLGREFNKFEIESPSFEEILLALKRRDGRRIALNVGLHPKLGKYYNMFCSKCRRRVLFKESKDQPNMILNRCKITDDFIIIYGNNPDMIKHDYIEKVAKNRMNCPACKQYEDKNSRIKLGVSERIEMISTYKTPKHPPHRPNYINAIPLFDIIRAIKRIKSVNSKTVTKEYENIIDRLGTEFNILVDLPLKTIENYDPNIASIIKAMRNNEINYTPGGGGRYGQIKLDI
jgi:uncharacterized protein (TIGR00375 family)